MDNLARSEALQDLDYHPVKAQIVCSRCSLASLCLPRRLSPEEVQRFEQIARRSRPIQCGEHLYRAGDPLEFVASVRTGCFKSYVNDRDGQEQVLGFYLPGEIVGLDAIQSHAHTASVVALSTSAVCSLAFESLSKMACQMPELQSELFRIMSLRINELQVNSGILGAEERIAIFLISLSRRFASYLRMASETVSRVLARFQKAGIVQVDRKEVTILELEKLREVSSNSASLVKTERCEIAEISLKF